MLNNPKVLLLLFACSLGTTGFSQESDRPNVLMICIDDMNDWVGFLDGHPQAKTPNMDKLASEGVNFTNAHCTAPGCSPSRNAILFGIEPHNSGLYPFYDIKEIEPEVLDPYTPLPMLFRDNGYETVGISKVFHNPDNTYKEHQQWDAYTSYDEELQMIDTLGYHPEPYNKRLDCGPASNPASDFRDRKSADHAVRYLQDAHDKPFFLSVGFILPHSPFVSPKENYDRFSEPVLPPDIKADDLSDIPLVGRSNAQINVEISVRSDDAWEEIRRSYLASISFTDDNVGLVLDALAGSPYADNTIIVLWSDHGYHLGEKRSFSKFSLWEEATRTPFIILDPRIKEGHGRKSGEAVGLIDVYETLCDLTDLEAPDYVDGMSLRPWLVNPELAKERPAMTTWGRGNYTLRTKEWRYTRYYDGSEELYNELDDPNEWNNLADDPQYNQLKEDFARKWLPKHEAPQVTSGRKLYNVVDADSPPKTLETFLHSVEKYKRLKIKPPLE